MKKLMSYEKEIAELREIFNKTPEIQITLPEELGIVSEYLKIPHKALKIIAAQQLEIEALKMEERNTAVFLSLADMAAGKAKEKAAKLQKENAQLKEKLELATRTAETNEIYLRKVFAELQNKLDRVATLDDLEKARMICKLALDMCEKRSEKIREQLNKN